MFDFIRTYQLDIMLGLSAACMSFVFLLFFTSFLEKRRKWIMIAMEFSATLLLFFDRQAYVYSGDTDTIATVMVRVSNFMVFFLTAGVLLVFDLYVMNLIKYDLKIEKMPKRLIGVGIASVVEMFLVVISQFTDMYYYFDDTNVYHRGDLFILCYIVPVFGPLVIYSVIINFRKKLRRLIYISLVLYIFLPITIGIIQIFSYGISIVNMSMVLVSIFLYVFTYLDINSEVMRVHDVEMGQLQEEKKSMKRLFDQTATAFVTAIEKRDVYSEGHSVRVANLSKKIAETVGKSEEECDEIYYAGLLHDVGLVAIPDGILKKTEALTEEEENIIKERPVIGGEILSNVKEYSSLKDSVTYSHERYDGTGYPKGLKGEDIPEFARIIGVADAYDSMTKKNRYRDSLAYQTVRERFVMGTGTQFDPVFSEVMIKIMDEERTKKDKEKDIQIEKEIRCAKYRENVSTGIRISEEVTKIEFKYEEALEKVGVFSAPSIVLFDSYDRRVHDNPKAIDAYRYLEYGEVWFDGNYISTGARNMEVKKALKNNDSEKQNKKIDVCTIEAFRFEDHFKMKLNSSRGTVELIMALPDKSKASYIGLTGENCSLTDISVLQSGESVAEGDIKKIIRDENYIDRLQSDVPNVQIDRDRSDTTCGVELKDELRIDFHTMSLPSANLVWHCPFILIYYSEDKKVNGTGYREYALIKINGECSSGDSRTQNKFKMKKNTTFPGWESWKDRNKEGMECSVELVRKGNTITTVTENLGIYIENTTVLSNAPDMVYVALTGDQVALTDIRLLGN